MNVPVASPPLGDPWTLPLDRIDVARSQLFQEDAWPDWFARLRRDDPVHFHAESEFGPFWSITRYRDIMKVETTPEVFSSELGITLFDTEEQYRTPMFIAMDPPKHNVQRRSWRRTTWRGWRRLSASAPPQSWRGCRATSRSTGWSGCRSSSPP